MSVSDGNFGGCGGAVVVVFLAVTLEVALGVVVAGGSDCGGVGSDFGVDGGGSCVGGCCGGRGSCVGVAWQ